MKIVICVHSLTGGGAERVASLWISGFYNRGYDVSVILADKQSPITYSIPVDIPIYYLGYNFKCKYFTYFFNKLFRSRNLKRVLRNIKPDVAIGVMYIWGEELLKARGNLSYKIVHTEHSSFERPPYAPVIPRNDYLRYVINKKVDIVTVLTQADKTYIGDKLQNVVVLPNPLSLNPMEQIHQKKNTILAVGRLDAWHVKGFDILIDAWSKIYSESKGWRLQIIGDSLTGEGLAYLKRLSIEKNVADLVDFIGFQNNIVDYYKDASIFVLSSRYEGFGMVLLEAMSQGCACIACDFNGRQREIIENSTQGLICAPDNSPQLAGSLLALINNENLRNRIQMGALKRSNDFSLNNIMDKWEKIINSLK